MELYINFGGFYDSVHTDNVDNAVDYLDMQDDERVNWIATYDSYAEAYLKNLNRIFKWNLKYIKLDSPRYYNFTTDKIVCEINYQDKSDILSDMGSQPFIDYVNEKLKSGPGFAGYYDNGVDPPYNVILALSLKNDDDRARLIELYIEREIEIGDINWEVCDLEFDVILFQD